MHRQNWVLLLAASAGILAPAAAALADIQWNLTYLDQGFGFTDPNLGAGRRQVATAVTTYLNTVFDESGTVDFQFNISLNQGNAGNGPLATSGPRFSTTPNGYQNGHLFTHATTNTDPSPANPDATAQVDFGYTWNNTTAQPQPFQVDLQSVLLHEFTHSLGILSRISSSGQSNVSNSDPGVYSVYNSFLRVGSTNGGTALFGSGGNYLGTPADLIDPTPGIYFWGANAMAANGGKPVRVFVQTNFNASSISHLAAASVMQPATTAGAVNRRFTAVDLGVLRDLGWKIKPQAPGTIGPGNFKILSASSSAPPSDNINNFSASGLLGGNDIDDGARAPLFLEDPASARPATPGSNGGGALTQLSHPDAPGAIALFADDARETAVGLTWCAMSENLAIPTAADMATRYSVSVNPNVRGGAADGTFADITFGAPAPGLAGGAPFTPGVGLRLYSSGARAGQYDLFDGTSGATLLESTGLFTSAQHPATDDLFDLSLEIIGATFDRAVPEQVNLYLGDELLHSFATDAGFLANYLTFFGGPSANPAGGGQALYAFSNLDLGVSQVPEPAALVGAGSLALLALGRSPRRR